MARFVNITKAGKHIFLGSHFDFSVLQLQNQARDTFLTYCHFRKGATYFCQRYGQNLFLL